jgi:hypothetical protein
MGETQGIDGEIAKRRQDLSAMTAPGPTIVFGEDDVSNVVAAIFDGPVTAIERQQSLRSRCPLVQARDAEDQLVTRRAVLYRKDLSFKAKYLGGVGECQVRRTIGRAYGSRFDPSMPFVDRLERRGKTISDPPRRLSRTRRPDSL